MPDLLIRNIRRLHQTRDTPANPLKKSTGLAELPSIDDAFIWIKGGIIEDFGSMKNCPDLRTKVMDLCGKKDLMPGFVDSHTHTVHAASREEEFVYKLQGLDYREIAARGGGILNSARKLQAISEEELYLRSLSFCREMIANGTGAIEIKSGYGLTVDAELKMLRVIRSLKESLPIPVKSTFLGAHALPDEYKSDKKAYLQLIRDEMLPNIAKEKLADYIDVFCEKGFFDEADTLQVIEWGEKFGLKAKIHTNQFNSIGGIEAAVKKGILSVDHLEVLNEREMNLLVDSEVLPVLLPSAAFFLRVPMPPARQMIEKDLPIVLASDFNPGSSPSYSMSTVLGLACVEMRMLPNEAFNAATLNASFALELQEEMGSISRKKRANLCILKEGRSTTHIPYHFGSDSIAEVVINGEVWSQ